LSELLPDLTALTAPIASIAAIRPLPSSQIPKPDKPEPNRLNCGTSETDCDGVADGNAH
jgi:hypothetical protein